MFLIYRSNAILTKSIIGVIVSYYTGKGAHQETFNAGIARNS